MASVLLDTVLHRGYAVVVPNCSKQGKDGQPLPLNDIKAVIRFLHNNGEGMSEYPLDIDTSFIAIGGFDVDGLSATMMGGKNWSSGGAELEGTVGNFLDKSSSVDAVASWAGTYLSLGELANYEWVFDRWLGGGYSESWDTSKFTMVSIATRMSDPAPTVLFHGSQDGTVKQADVAWFYAYLQDRLGADSEYYLMNGVGHDMITNSSKYYYYGYLVNFLDRIRAKKATTGIDQISDHQTSGVQKITKDAQILILLGDKTYTLTGQEVK
jgi:acetyl esterase/lipase